MSVRWSEVTAIFGGTFDPPHLGHREAVRGLFRQPGVRRVLVIPAATPPHKKQFAPSEHRVAMARLNFTPTPEEPYPVDVTVDLREIERAARTGKASYAFDTIESLRHEVRELAFVIGTDQLRNLPRWYRFPEVLTLCHWIVLARKPEGEARTAEYLKPLEASGLLRPAGPAVWQIGAQGRDPERLLIVVATTAPEVSSTAIREALARTGQPPANALLEPVSGYLKDRHLYGT